MLRSIKKAYDIIHADDPDSSITVHTIRMWCKSEQIRYIMAGNRILVDMQSLMDFIEQKK